MKDQYIILTGSKNNAGDYLIKYRSKQLFEEFRSDRKIIDYNAWESFDQNQVDEVNNSKALILLGGPALQSVMRPQIYPMVGDLNKISAPVIMMGVGWKSKNGDWHDTYRYPLNDETIELLKKIDQSGYQSSVRDYHTLNAIRFKGFNNFIMTGCPAYYDLPSISKDINLPVAFKKVAFSLGVAFVNSKSIEKQMKELILKCKEYFSRSNFEVVFHHSLDRNKYFSAYVDNSKHFDSHNDFAQWLESKHIRFIDISGSAENLISYYNNVDFHIGYRVHAHIFMNSVSKLSFLIAEDGRAKATKEVIGGIVLDGYKKKSTKLLLKIFNKIFNLHDEKYEANLYLTKELIENINYEKKVEFHRIKNSRNLIDNNLRMMKLFLQQLP